MLKKQFGPERQLALTVAMEHFTASHAEFLLENPDVLDQAPKTIKQMLLWHAVEEIEHKSVAFDVFRDQINNEWIGITRFFWGKKGILRANIHSLNQFFQPDFHPEDIDQSELIKGWEKRFPDIAALEA